MTTRSQTLFERLSEAMQAVLPVELAEDVRKNLNASVRGVCERLDLVTREELEVQEAVLRRTREKLERLEAQVLELEKRLLASADG